VGDHPTQINRQCTHVTIALYKEPRTSGRALLAGLLANLHAAHADHRSEQMLAALARSAKVFPERVREHYNRCLRTRMATLYDMIHPGTDTIN
jgi:hypothetical protein